MQYGILNRLLQLTRPRWIARMLLVVSVSTIVTGCGYSYSYEEALAENTPYAYMKFIEYNTRSKHREAARQHLQDLFQQANIKKITICYLRFVDENDARGGRWRAFWWGGNSYMHDEVANSYEGESLWASIKTLVEKELKVKGYQVQFGARIRSTFKGKNSWRQLHSVTSQYPFESVDSTVNIEQGAITNGPIPNRLTPKHYLAIESFLKSRSWPDSDAVLLVTIPLVRNAVDYANYNPLGGAGLRDTSEISSLTIVYHLFDAESKRQVFGNYLISIKRERETTSSKSTLYSTVRYWNFIENTDMFFSRAVSTLFKDFPAATGKSELTPNTDLLANVN